MGPRAKQGLSAEGAPPSKRSGGVREGKVKPRMGVAVKEPGRCAPARAPPPPPPPNRGRVGSVRAAWTMVWHRPWEKGGGVGWGGGAGGRREKARGGGAWGGRHHFNVEFQA